MSESQDPSKVSREKATVLNDGSSISKEHEDHDQDDQVGSNGVADVEQQQQQQQQQKTMPGAEETVEQGQSQSQSAAPPKQYSVWSKGEKRLIISVGSLAGFFSPLSSSIYFPALNTIATALQVSGSKINLTVTTYLILQGAAPMMIAGFSDSMGRRPAYVMCFVIYLAANLGLALQDSYAALLVLRCMQSAGSSGTVALANGLVGDTVTSDERGQYIAFASLGGLLGPSIAPIIGGAISQSLDWHWIFWFLLIFAGVFCIPLFLFLPETCRAIVGDGSIAPPPLNRSLTDVIRLRRRRRREEERQTQPETETHGDGGQPQPHDPAEKAAAPPHEKYRIRLPNPWPTIQILFDLESLIILVATGLALACFYAISTGAASAMEEVYGFNDIQIALMFIPIGAGGVVSAFTTGRLIDWNYRRHAGKLGLRIVKGVRQDLSEFPIERARIEVALPLVVLCAAFVVGYGWSMDHKLSLAAPVILLFLLGYTSIAVYQTLNVLMTDIWPGKAAAATAANNFVRCEIGAAASAAIDPMSKAMGRGWAYTTCALIWLVSAPTLLIIVHRGVNMRKARKERQERRKLRKREHALRRNR